MAVSIFGHEQRGKSNIYMGWITAMNFAAFDLNLLRVFDALMRERSATRAGDMIGLSQPAVSNALNRLRHALKDDLFIRRGNDMVPTPRAETLAEQVRDALAKLEQALASSATFDPASAEQTFTLLGSDMFSIHFMPRFAESIAAKAPRLRLRLLDSAFGAIERLLRDNAIDVALERTYSLPDWVSRREMYDSSFAIIAARDNEAIRKAGLKPGRKLPLKLFLELPHAVRSPHGDLSGLVDHALNKIGETRHIALTLPHYQSIALAVARGRLIAAVPTQFAHAMEKELGLVMYRSPVELGERKMWMYWHKRDDRSLAHVWLRNEILATIQRLRWGNA
jgi:DNA-binding transcriptional LysR family regulator